MAYGRRFSSANRFDNYREILAKFASTGTCGHPINKGEVIGYNKTHGTRCSACWAKWSDENREAAAYEASIGSVGMSDFERGERY